MQHEAAAGIDRAALQHLHGLGIFRQLDLVGVLDDVELHQQPREIDAAGRAVDDDAHRAFGRMRAHIDHRTLEARIAHDGHRDQQLAVQIAVVGRIIANAGGFAASRASVSCLQGSSAKASHADSYPDIGWRFCQSSQGLTRHSRSFAPFRDHKQFNGLRADLPVKTSHDRHSSHARRARRRRHLVCRMCGDRGSRRGFLAVAARRAFRGPPAGGIAQRRGAARRYRHSSCSRDGIPTGGRPAIPACRRASTSPNRTMSRP